MNQYNMGSVGLVYAHRGASGYAPENTMAAFAKAAELGSPGIECDVQMTRDGKLVVCHDERVDRTTDGTGYIKDLTLAGIKSLDAGSWFAEQYRGERIPELHELLALAADKGIFVNVELKNSIVFYPNIEEKVLEALGKYNMLDQTVVSSFNHNSVKRIKQLNRRVLCGILYTERLEAPWEYMKSIGCECAHPYYPTLDRSLCSELRRRGFIINAFTIDDPDTSRVLASWGVNGIITDYPDRILKALVPA